MDCVEKGHSQNIGLEANAKSKAKLVETAHETTILLSFTDCSNAH